MIPFLIQQLVAVAYVVGVSCAAVAIAFMLPARLQPAIFFVIPPLCFAGGVFVPRWHPQGLRLSRWCWVGPAVLPVLGIFTLAADLAIGVFSVLVAMLIVLMLALYSAGSTAADSVMLAQAISAIRQSPAAPKDF